MHLSSNDSWSWIVIITITMFLQILWNYFKVVEDELYTKKNLALVLQGVSKNLIQMVSKVCEKPVNFITN